jgi:hypothetical protein
MSVIDAESIYPDSYILMRTDTLESDTGRVLFIGDERDELYKAMDTLLDDTNCVILEGLKRQLYLGGVVVCG